MAMELGVEPSSLICPTWTEGPITEQLPGHVTLNPLPLNAAFILPVVVLSFSQPVALNMNNTDKSPDALFGMQNISQLI